MSLDKNSSAFQHLVCAAKKIMKGFHSPSELVVFLSDASIRHHSFLISPFYGKDAKEKHDQHFAINLLIQELVPRWIAGGTAVADNMAEGINELIEFYGHEGLQHLYCQLLRDWGAYNQDLYHNHESQKQFLKQVAAFEEMCESVAQFIDASENTTSLVAA